MKIIPLLMLLSVTIISVQVNRPVIADTQNLKSATPGDNATSADSVCSLTISLAREKYSAGEDIVISTVLANTGSKTVIVPDSGSLRNFRMTVLEANPNKAVPRTRYGISCALPQGPHSMRETQLSPGYQLSQPINLSRCFDMSDEEVYIVTFSQYVGDASNAYHWVTSNTLRITIGQEDQAFYQPSLVPIMAKSPASP